MVVFWLTCGVLILAALGFVLPPLLRGTSDSTRPLALLVALLIPIVAIGLYQRLGNPRAFDPTLQSVTRAMQHAQQAGLPPVEQALAGLRERLAHQPDDLEGWMLLGRTLKSLERFDEAREAFERAQALAPQDAEVLAESAEVLTLAAPDRRFPAEALARLNQALVIDPSNQRALWLRGIAHYQSGEHEAAAATWERLLQILPEDNPVRDTIRQRIAELKSGAPLGSDATATSPAHATAPRLQVTVELAADLAAQVQADDTVFVFARAAEGGRAPVALERRRAAELPFSVELDDSDAMLPQFTLSSTPRIVVGARISRSGNAQAQSGDLETLSEAMPNTHVEPIELRIDHRVP